MRRPRATIRNARSASSRYARGKRSSKPPTASRSARRYAQSAVIHCDVARPATLRSQSVGLRSAGSGTRTCACEPATSAGRSRKSRSRSASHVSLSSTSSSTNAIQSARAARQPMLRADAGPADFPASTMMRAARSGSRPARSSGAPRSRRSSTRMTRAGRGPEQRASEASSARSEGRPMVGTTSSITVVRPRRRRPRRRARSSRARAGTARSPARRPAPSRSTPARRAGRPPSAGRRC